MVDRGAWAAALLTFLAACGGSPGLATGDGGDMLDAIASGDANDAGVASRDGPLNVTFGATIFRTGSDVELLGAKVCLVGQPESSCELTDTIGRVRLTVPAESNQAIAISAPGFGSSVAAFRMGRSDLTGVTITIPTDTEQRAYYQAAGVEWPSKTSAYLYVFAYDQMNEKLAGLTMSLSPSSGSGALYDNELGIADPSLKATSSSGLSHFAGITGSEVNVSFGPSNLLCSSIFGSWPSDTANTVRIPVVPGFETILGVRCF